MEVTLPFVTQNIQPIKRKKKNKRPIKRTIIKIKTEHTPMEIQNMDLSQLEYLYEHGSPTEKELADRMIRIRKKWAMASLLSDDILPTGSPIIGAPNAYIVGQRGD